MKRMKRLKTPHGDITFPAFMPVTTFGDKYPLDRMVRPYLGRVSQCLMVSYHYVQEMKQRPTMPLFVDSGGFAGLFEGAVFADCGDHARIQTADGKVLDPLEILEFQVKIADIGATLDFIIPPGLPEDECRRRQELTIKNALYAMKHKKEDGMTLFASLQCWDEESARRSAKIYSDAGFDGIAVGGMVPRAKDREYIKMVVRAVREEAPCCLIHVFGCGNPDLIPDLIEAGADSFDSSSYIRKAADKAGSGSGIHTGMYEAVKQLYQIEETMKGVSGSYNINVPNYWVV